MSGSPGDKHPKRASNGEQLTKESLQWFHSKHQRWLERKRRGVTRRSLSSTQSPIASGSTARSDAQTSPPTSVSPKAPASVKINLCLTSTTDQKSTADDPSSHAKSQSMPIQQLGSPTERGMGHLFGGNAFQKLVPEDTSSMESSLAKTEQSTCGSPRREADQAMHQNMPQSSHRQCLIEFYEKYNPSKLSTVDETLVNYQGREEMLFQKLQEKYVEGKDGILPPSGTGPLCFLDFEVGGNHVGRVVVKLFHNKAPLACENFRCLCTGELGQGRMGKPLCFQNCEIHRIVPNFCVQGGDITNGDGTGGESIYPPNSEHGDMWGKFKDETPFLQHSRKGLLSMANNGPNRNGSQFFFTLKAIPNLDGKHVVFGEVVEGLDVVEHLGAVETNIKQQPLQPVIIRNCGELGTEREELNEILTAGSVVEADANSMVPTIIGASHIYTTQQSMIASGDGKASNPFSAFSNLSIASTASAPSFTFGQGVNSPGPLSIVPRSSEKKPLASFSFGNTPPGGGSGSTANAPNPFSSPSIANFSKPVLSVSKSGPLKYDGFGVTPTRTSVSPLPVGSNNSGSAAHLSESPQQLSGFALTAAGEPGPDVPVAELSNPMVEVNPPTRLHSTLVPAPLETKQAGLSDAATRFASPGPLEKLTNTGRKMSVCSSQSECSNDGSESSVPFVDVDSLPKNRGKTKEPSVAFGEGLKLAGFRLPPPKAEDNHSDPASADSPFVKISKPLIGQDNEPIRPQIAGIPSLPGSDHHSSNFSDSSSALYSALEERPGDLQNESPPTQISVSTSLPCRSGTEEKVASQTPEPVGLGEQGAMNLDQALNRSTTSEPAGQGINELESYDAVAIADIHGGPGDDGYCSASPSSGHADNEPVIPGLRQTSTFPPIGSMRVASHKTAEEIELSADSTNTPPCHKPVNSKQGLGSRKLGRSTDKMKTPPTKAGEDATSFFYKVLTSPNLKLKRRFQILSGPSTGPGREIRLFVEHRKRLSCDPLLVRLCNETGIRTMGEAYLFNADKSWHVIPLQGSTTSKQLKTKFTALQAKWSVLRDFTTRPFSPPSSPVREDDGYLHKRNQVDPLLPLLRMACGDSVPRRRRVWFGSSSKFGSSGKQAEKSIDPAGGVDPIFLALGASPKQPLP